MKVILSESQVNRSVEVFNKLMNTIKYDYVCRIMVDYDNESDKYVLNIIFDRDSIHIRKGSISRAISERFVNWTGQVPYLYTHFEKCS